MAGLPKPKIYFINEESMNAFSTGRNPNTASIALTKGIVEKLDKSELQAVIAHELAHIGNRDTCLMQIVITGIGCFIFFGESLSGLSVSGQKSRGGGISVLRFVGIICLVFGIIIAPILRFALSRLQEYQADVTAAKITRDPEALVRALFKIMKNSMNNGFDSSPLIKPFINNICITTTAKTGFFNFASKLNATHPPIEDRIAALKK